MVNHLQMGPFLWLRPVDQRSRQPRLCMRCMRGAAICRDVHLGCLAMDKAVDIIRT